jgi:hypothetical protein
MTANHPNRRIQKRADRKIDDRKMEAEPFHYDSSFCQFNEIRMIRDDILLPMTEVCHFSVINLSVSRIQPTSDR